MTLSTIVSIQWNNGNARLGLDILYILIIKIALFFSFDESKSRVIISKIEKFVRFWISYFLKTGCKDYIGSSISTGKGSFIAPNGIFHQLTVASSYELSLSIIEYFKIILAVTLQ
ncbi:MAG TPA: hypothetical protein DHV46_01775 [Desulfovibrio piger]|nr:hypothetical protein [Desulfovibrio piger]